MRLLNTLNFLVARNQLGVKYSRLPETVKNWGDALNAYLISRVSGKEVVHYGSYYNTGWKPTLAGIGSILDNNAVKNLVVWGSGFKSEAAVMRVNPVTVCAVRGQLTRKKLLQAGLACPEVYGDPAIALPRFYQSKITKPSFRLGIIPHYVDKVDSRVLALSRQPGVKVIDVLSDIEDFVDQLCACEVIMSSSLHGLIAADAYGRPRIWMKLSDRIAGDSFKFNDYFSSTSEPTIQAVTLSGNERVEDLVSLGVKPDRLPDVDLLLRVFPRL